MSHKPANQDAGLINAPFLKGAQVVTIRGIVDGEISGSYGILDDRSQKEPIPDGRIPLEDEVEAALEGAAE